MVETILAQTEGRGVDNSCEFSGSAVALANAITSTRMGGYLNILSVYGDSITPVPMNEIVFRYLHVKGINGRKMWSTWNEMHDLLAKGAIAVESMISHRFPVADFKTAMELVASGDCAKVVLDF